MYEIISNSIIFTKARKELDIIKVLSIFKEEITVVGKTTLEILESYNLNLQTKYWNLSWGIHSIMEFQDLLDLNITLNIKSVISDYKFMQQNYCYYEAVNVLREAYICGINGCFSASFACLRSSLELTLLHCYWKNKQINFGLNKFYKWIDGKKEKPTFSQLLSSFQQNYIFPKEWNIISKVREFYKKMCSYSHAPIINESITRMKGTNRSVIATNVLDYWIDLFTSGVDLILHLLIVTYPMCLFPVDITKKFGFHGPVGIFFDRYNSLPLKRYLSNKTYENYRNVFKESEDVINYMDFYNSQKDLSIEEVLNSWKNSEKKLLNKNIKENLDGIDSFDNAKLIKLITIAKAKNRAFAISFAYSDGKIQEDKPSKDDSRVQLKNKVFIANDEIENKESKDIYAYFGLTIYYYQVLEHQIINMLFIYNLDKKKQISKDNLDRFFKNEKLKSHTQLINNLFKTYKLKEEDKKELNKLLCIIKYVTKDYFKDNINLMFSQNGRKSIINYLRDITNRIKSMDKKLEEISKNYYEKIGINEELLTKSFQKYKRYLKEKNNILDI